MEKLIVQKGYHLTLIKEVLCYKKKSQKASHPLCFAKNVIIEFWKGTDNNVYSFLFHQVHLGQGIHEWTK